MADLMAQNIDQKISVCLPLLLNAERVDGDLGKPCKLRISLKVTIDATKDLLKYHPKVNINLQVDQVRDRVDQESAASSLADGIFDPSFGILGDSCGLLCVCCCR